MRYVGWCSKTLGLYRLTGLNRRSCLTAIVIDEMIV